VAANSASPTVLDRILYEAYTVEIGQDTDEGSGFSDSASGGKIIRSHLGGVDESMIVKRRIWLR
jgi:hypothetical protein